MRRRTAIIVSAVLSLVVGVAAGAATVQRFSDVPEDHWATTYMEWADDAGIITANADGAFRPNETVTRAQLASYFYKFEGYLDRYDSLTIAEIGDFYDIVYSTGSDGTVYSTSIGFDEAYTYEEVYDLVSDLCETLGDTPASASLRDTQNVIPNWIEGTTWKRATDNDKWRVVFYGHWALCSEYNSIYEVWSDADWPPLDFG